MIFVDSSVWIDVLRGVTSLETKRFNDLLSRDQLCTGDVVLSEVLQGIDDERRFERTRAAMMLLPVVTVSNADIAVLAARHYRVLRRKGITISKTIDTLIATRCIVDDLALLHADRDFAPFVEHLGLRDAMAQA